MRHQTYTSYWQPVTPGLLSSSVLVIILNVTKNKYKAYIHYPIGRHARRPYRSGRFAWSKGKEDVKK